MSLLSIAPGVVAAASGNLANLNSALRSANTAAANQTTAIVAPAADEVSAAATALFNADAQQFQTLSAKAAAFHDEFVSLLSGGAAQYLSTEAANVQQTLANAVSAPAQALLGHPLIGNAVRAESTDIGVINSAFQNSSFSQRFGPFELDGWTTVSGTTTNGALNVSLPTPFGAFPLLSTTFLSSPNSFLSSGSMLPGFGSGYGSWNFGLVPFSSGAGSGYHFFASGSGAWGMETTRLDLFTTLDTLGNTSATGSLTYGFPLLGPTGFALTESGPAGAPQNLTTVTAIVGGWRFPIPL